MPMRFLHHTCQAFKLLGLGAVAQLDDQAFAPLLTSTQQVQIWAKSSFSRTRLRQDSFWRLACFLQRVTASLIASTGKAVQLHLEDAVPEGITCL